MICPEAFEVRVPLLDFKVRDRHGVGRIWYISTIETKKKKEKELKQGKANLHKIIIVMV